MGTEMEILGKMTFSKFIGMGLKVRKIMTLWNDEGFRPYTILKTVAGGEWFIIHIEFQGP